MPIQSNYILPSSHPALQSPLSKNKTTLSSLHDKSKVTKKQANNKLNVILRKNQSQSELAQYYHATFLCPANSAFTKAMCNNHFTMARSYFTLDSEAATYIHTHLSRPSKSEKQGL